MKLPGRAWLEFAVEPCEQGSRIQQTALFDPAGLSGRLYWYGILPLHALVFRSLLAGIARAAQQSGSDGAGPSPLYSRRGGKEPAMGIQDRYLAYADAFEETYVDDDWSRIEPFFTEGAVYEGPPDATGRAALLAKLKGGIDAFDRRMDSRRVDFETPTVDGNAVTVAWKATYTKTGRPDLKIFGTETAIFEGDRIACLRDDFAPEAQKAMAEWMAAPGSALRAG
jgi:hypothetical protein